MYTRRGGVGGGVWRPLILLFIPINTILSMGACTVGGGEEGPPSWCGWAPPGPSPLPLHTFAPGRRLYNSVHGRRGRGPGGVRGMGGVISPVGEQHQAWGVKEILKTTHSSHQNKSGRIKGTQICPFFAGGGGKRWSWGAGIVVRG